MLVGFILSDASLRRRFIPSWCWGITEKKRAQIIPKQYKVSHWVRATHIWVGKLTTIGSDNGLSPGRRQAIIWTIAEILLIGPLGTYFSEIVIGIGTFSFKKMLSKMSSAKWCPSCLGLNVLSHHHDGALWCLLLLFCRKFSVITGPRCISTRQYLLSCFKVLIF